MKPGSIQPVPLKSDRRDPTSAALPRTGELFIGRTTPAWWRTRRGRVVLLALLATLAIELALLPKVLLRPNPEVTVLNEVGPRAAIAPASSSAGSPGAALDRAAVDQIVVESIRNVPNGVPETVAAP